LAQRKLRNLKGNEFTPLKFRNPLGCWRGAGSQRPKSCCSWSDSNAVIARLVLTTIEHWPPFRRRGYDLVNGMARMAAGTLEALAGPRCWAVRARSP
jgi:hypothetical protein